MAGAWGLSGPRKFQAREIETEREKNRDSVQGEVLQAAMGAPQNVRDHMAQQLGNAWGKGLLCDTP